MALSELFLACCDTSYRDATVFCKTLLTFPQHISVRKWKYPCTHQLTEVTCPIPI